MPLQVVCYERADELGFGVSGVTRARGFRAASPSSTRRRSRWRRGSATRRSLYLLDPVGACRRSAALRAADAAITRVALRPPVPRHAVELPYTPAFLHKQDGFVFSMGSQCSGWASSSAAGTVQIWPGTPVASALVEGRP